MKRILFFLAGKTEGWAWLHGPFRLAAIYVLTPVLNFSFRNLAARLECRHSVLSPRGFNIFRSDIDYALVFTDEPKGDILERAKRRYFFAKSLFPYLGELEIYSEGEWRRKRKLDGPAAQLVYFLRKCGWLFQSIGQSRDPFERRKAERAVMRLIGMGGGEYSIGAVEKIAGERVRHFLRAFPRVTLDREVETFSDFLGWSFGTGFNPDKHPYLNLTSEECLLLAAVIPGGHYTLPEEQSLLSQLRAAPTVAEAFRETCEAEYLLCRSVERTSGTFDPQLSKWIKELIDTSTSEEYSCPLN